MASSFFNVAKKLSATALSFGNSAGVQAYAYPAGSHRLMSVNGVDRTYDAMGNTLTIGGEWQYVYDLAGPLGSATRTGSTQASYRHNAAGQRVLQQVGIDRTLHLLGEGGEWLGSYGATGAPAQQVVWLGTRPVGLIQAGKVLYIESDHLGSPRAVIDPQRDVAVWRWSLLGEAFRDGSPDEDPDQDGVAQRFDLRFPGQRADLSSGLTYNYFRDYDPRIGRYAESDPIGLDGGLNTYAYVGGSPVRFKDPFGLQTTVDMCIKRYGVEACVPPPPRPSKPPGLNGWAANVWCAITGACQMQEPADPPPLPTDPTECPGQGWYGGAAVRREARRETGSIPRRAASSIQTLGMHHPKGLTGAIQTGTVKSGTTSLMAGVGSQAT